MNIKNSKNNKHLINMQKLFKKTTIYVVRCDSKNNLQDSAPCHSCLNMIILLNIKRIVFSSKENTFISSDPIKLNINHVSAGNKFLNKKTTNNNTNNTNNTNNKNNKNNNNNNNNNNNTNNTKNTNNNIKNTNNNNIDYMRCTYCDDKENIEI
tara:strand:+ start:237 stop:695 length:459 start_codon:yes stop_codon:yes gene_type:complete